MSLVESIEPSADRWMDDLIALRRTIHAHPELAFEEHETAQRVQEFLAQLGIPSARASAGPASSRCLTGAQGRTDGRDPRRHGRAADERPAGPAVRVQGSRARCTRAAMTRTPRSRCGVAAVLADSAQHLAGRVMFIFQPAEETLAGARAMLDAGVFDEKPDAILGFHNWPPLATGTVGWHPEAVMASSDAFDVTIKGTAGHGAHPHLASMRSSARRIRHPGADDRQPRDRAGQLGGPDHRPDQRRHRANIIAPSVELKASVRTLESAIADKIEAAVRRILEGLKTGIARRLRAQMDEADAGAAQRQADDEPRAERRARDARPGERHRDAGAEHGQRGLRVVRRARAFGAPADRLEIDGLDTAIHRTDYQLNEQMIPLGTKLMTRAVLELLG